jgi:formylglycine-generating enzyme
VLPLTVLRLRGLLRHPAWPTAWGVAAAALIALGSSPLEAKGKGCPEGMTSIRGRYCIDQYEAHTVEMLGKGRTRPHSPFEPVDGLHVKAVSRRKVTPQAHISKVQAEAACKNAGKRLCTDDEWIGACRGKKPTTYPYGDEHKAGYCNDRGVSSFNRYYGEDGGEAPQASYTWANMNDRRLNQLEGTLAPTGAFKRCKNGFDVYDMVGNLHEWTAAVGGTFRGGYYLDTHQHGDGCDYKTTAHTAKYYDYSTGFRCCK